MPSLGGVLAGEAFGALPCTLGEPIAEPQLSLRRPSSVHP